MNALDLTKPLQLSDGRPARLLCADFKSPSGRSVCVAADCGITELAYLFSPTGESEPRSAITLINVPVKRTVDFWINVYGDLHQEVHETRKRADNWAHSGRIACLRFTREFVEGEGL